MIPLVIAVAENVREKNPETNRTLTVMANEMIDPDLAAIMRVDRHAHEIIDMSAHVKYYTFENEKWKETKIVGNFFVYSRDVEPHRSLLLDDSKNPLVEPITAGITIGNTTPFLTLCNERNRIFGFWFETSAECDRISKLIRGPPKGKLASMSTAPAKEYSDSKNSPTQATPPSTPEKNIQQMGMGDGDTIKKKEKKREGKNKMTRLKTGKSAKLADTPKKTGVGVSNANQKAAKNESNKTSNKNAMLTDEDFPKLQKKSSHEEQPQLKQNDNLTI